MSASAIQKLTPVPELTTCGWCGVRPGDQHDKECPDRDDATDFPAFCAACGVTYSTNCDCDQETDR